MLVYLLQYNMWFVLILDYMGGSTSFSRRSQYFLILNKSGLSFLILLCTPCLVLAEDNLHIKSMVIHPYVSIDTVRSDNIYFTPASKQSGYSVTTSPGIKLELPLNRHLFSLDYNSAVTRYVDFRSENTTDHNVTGLMDLKFRSLIGLKLLTMHSKDHEPKSSSHTGIIEKYEKDAFTASVSYQLAGVSKVEMDYTAIEWDFNTSSFRERDENLISGAIYYRILPKTSAFLEYDLRDTDYVPLSNFTDNESDSVLMGLKWGINDRSQGVIKGGYAWKDFDSAYKSDYDTWTLSVDLKHRFTDYTVLSLVHNRTVIEAAIQGADLILSSDSHANLSHRIFTKIDAVFHGYYSKDKFFDVSSGHDEIREDRTIAAGAGVKYSFNDFLTLLLDYGHRERDSSDDSSDYDNNSYTFSLNFEL